MLLIPSNASPPSVARSLGCSGGVGQGSHELDAHEYSVTTAFPPAFAIVSTYFGRYAESFKARRSLLIAAFNPCSKSTNVPSVQSSSRCCSRVTTAPGVESSKTRSCTGWPRAGLQGPVSQPE